MFLSMMIKYYQLLNKVCGYIKLFYYKNRFFSTLNMASILMLMVHLIRNIGASVDSCSYLISAVIHQSSQWYITVLTSNRFQSASTCPVWVILPHYSLRFLFFEDKSGTRVLSFAVVTTLPHRCAFWDAFLPTTIVNSDYLRHCSLIVSLTQSDHCPETSIISVVFLLAGLLLTGCFLLFVQFHVDFTVCYSMQWIKIFQKHPKKPL